MEEHEENVGKQDLMKNEEYKSISSKEEEKLERQRKRQENIMWKSQLLSDVDLYIYIYI